MGYLLTGPVETMVWDFIRTKHAIRLEAKGLRRSQGSALQAARQKGYVPDALLLRGNVQVRRDRAMAYMEYVTTLLTSGGMAKAYGEEVVTGRLLYAQTDECGCPAFSGTDESEFITATETATMCIHEKAHNLGNEVRLSDCEYGCKVYSCSCGDEHLSHSRIYGCREGE